VKSLASRWRKTWRAEEKSWCSGEHQAADGRRKRSRSFSPATNVLVIERGECLTSGVPSTGAQTAASGAMILNLHKALHNVIL
jgi:hypothetical protein